MDDIISFILKEMPKFNNSLQKFRNENYLKKALKKLFWYLLMIMLLTECLIISRNSNLTKNFKY